jgi:hypothetical protein
LFATERDTAFWQVQAFDNDGRLWRPGDELPTVAGTGISRYGLSRLAAFQDVGVELPPDYQVSVMGSADESSDHGVLATVRDGRLVEVDVPRDPELPWLYYYGRLGQAGDRPELEDRIRDQSERLERARMASVNGLTGTIGPHRKVEWYEYEDKRPFFDISDVELKRRVDAELMLVDWPHERVPGHINFAHYLYAELTPERQRQIVDHCFEIAQRDTPPPDSTTVRARSGFAGMTREQIHEILLRKNNELCDCPEQC